MSTHEGPHKENIAASGIDDLPDDFAARLRQHEYAEPQRTAQPTDHPKPSPKPDKSRQEIFRNFATNLGEAASSQGGSSPVAANALLKLADGSFADDMDVDGLGRADRRALKDTAEFLTHLLGIEPDNGDERTIIEPIFTDAPEERTLPLYTRPGDAPTTSFPVAGQSPFHRIKDDKTFASDETVVFPGQADATVVIGRLPVDSLDAPTARIYPHEFK
jgi:hypothetical protein